MSKHFWTKTCLLLWIPFTFVFEWGCVFQPFLVFKYFVSNDIPGKLDDDRSWLFALFTFSPPMALIYINICELFLQKLIQGFRHNNISIFILTLLYTMHQNAFYIPYACQSFYLNNLFFLFCFVFFIHLSCRFFQFINFLLFLISLQFVKFFIVKFYSF